MSRTVVSRGRELLRSGVYNSTFLRNLVKTGLLATSAKLRYGTNVYERDWDVLVVLDTCRYDAFVEVAPKFDVLSDAVYDSIQSVGSATAEWGANTFVQNYRREVAETVYVTANGTPQWTMEGERDQFNKILTDYVDWGMVSAEEFRRLDGVWEYAPHEPFSGLTIPEAVTDRAIAAHQELNPDRLIAHYMPPHAPYRASALAENRPLRDYERDPWKALRSGTAREVVWSAYLDEVRWALEHVETLLRNVDAESVVITADHGELFGEWGLYAHPSGIPHPKLRTVPWVKTTAQNVDGREPSLTARNGYQTQVTDQLEKLGYL